MPSNISFSQKIWFLIAIFGVGILGGLLSFVMATNFYRREDGAARVEKITEKQVYVESSATISAINTISDSLISVVPATDLVGRLLTPESLPALCREEPVFCNNNAVVLTSDGIILYGNDDEGVENGNLRAIDNDGLIYELELLNRVTGFSLLRLVKSGEMSLPVEARAKFLGVKPVLINDLSGVEVGQKILKMVRHLGNARKVEESQVRDLFKLDGFLIDTESNERTIEIGVENGGLGEAFGGVYFDLAGQMIALENNTGTLLTGEQILALLDRATSNEKDISSISFGARCLRINQNLAKQLKLAVDYGCLVTEGIDNTYQLTSGGIKAGSVAVTMGLKSGDLILDVDGKSLLDSSILGILMGKAHGEDLILTVLRSGQTLTLKGVLL